MEGLIAFFVVVLVAIVPGLPLWALLTARGARRRIERLEAMTEAQQGMIDALELRLRELGRRIAQLPAPERAPESASPIGETPRPSGATKAAWRPPPAVAERPPEPVEPAAPEPVGPAPLEPATLVEDAARPEPEAPAEVAPPLAAAPSPEVAPHEAPTGAAAEAAPPGPPAPDLSSFPPPAEPAPPPRAAIDWEALLGVRGAAWIGAVALVIAGSLFAKYSFEHNLIPPAVRVALIILSGAGALLAAELVLRRGYATTANAACGAGVALLYAGFFSAHAVYKLIPLAPTFGLMVMTTVVACLLAVRHDAVFIAILGLLGGFATPLALSTGQDRPVGLFSYVLLLDVGLLFIAVRKRWSTLAHLSLAATLLLEVAWFSRYMAPEKLPIAAGAFGLFALLYLIIPSLAPEGQRRDLLRGSLVGGLSPFAFVAYLAPQASYSGEWPIFFLLMACLDAAIIVVALRRGQVQLLLSAAIATVLSLWLWTADGLGSGNRVGATVFAIALFALLSLPPRLAALRLLAPTPPSREPLEIAGLLAFSGLWGFGAALVSKGAGSPPWALLLLLAALIALALERSRREGLGRIGTLAPLAVALLAEGWMLSDPSGPTAAARLLDLGVPLLCAAAFSIAATLRTRTWRDAGGDLPDRSADSEIGAALAALVAVAGLLPALDREALGADPRPLAAALLVGLFLLWGVALRRGYTVLLPIGLFLSAAVFSAWRKRYFEVDDLGRAWVISVVLYLGHLAAPFLVPPSIPGWRERRGPWITAALSGPLFFPVLYQLFVATWGKAFIGALPVLMAALSLLALAGVRERFPAGEEALGRQRLRNLALLAAVALGFVSVAIPLQLDRQWITIGWALECAAVLWLYVRLPHVGLKYFGGVLGLAAAARLLLNPAVLRYAERGWPVLNWILYTYGVSAAALLVGAALLGPVEEERLSARERQALGAKLRWTPLLQGLALLLIFALLNLEIHDYYSTGRYLEVSFELQYARDLTTSVVWALYALCLLGIGMWRRSRALRFVSLGFMLLCLGKVALHDLSRLTGLYQVLSFLGLAFALILVSLLYQRFVFRKEPTS